MIQLYITYLIVLIAFSISFYRLYEFLFKKKVKCTCMGGCTLKSDIVRNIKTKPIPQFKNINILEK